MVLAGLGASVLVSLVPERARAVLATGLALVCAGLLGWQAQRTTFAYRDDQPSPYAYAQPTRGLVEMETKVNDLARFSPQKDEIMAQIVFRDEYYWPLPWTLRRLKNIGYRVGKVPEESEVRLQGTPIILFSAEMDEELTARLNSTHYMTGFHTLREGVLVHAWVQNGLWEPLVMSRPRPRPEE